MRARLLVAAAVVLSLAGSSLAQEAPAIVHLADGSSIPLMQWSLSYEYQTWKEGTSPALTSPTRREARQLFAGKKSFPLAGTVLEIQQRVFERGAGAEGEQVQGAIVTGLVLRAGTQRTELKQIEPPHRDLLVPPPGAKGMAVLARGLDLVGETLTGTKRNFCLIGYSQVECSAAPGERVVKVEFPK